MLLAVASFLMVNAAMFSCMFMEINGHLYETSPFASYTTTVAREQS